MNWTYFLVFRLEYIDSLLIAFQLIFLRIIIPKITVKQKPLCFFIKMDILTFWYLLWSCFALSENS